MIYILHIDPPLKHARHYVGWTADADVTRRVKEHLEQKGRRPSRLVGAALTAGCQVSLVASFEGTRDDERRLKNNGAATRYCPLCRPAYNRRAADRMRAKRQRDANKTGEASEEAITGRY
jgi:hypothetical protein